MSTDRRKGVRRNLAHGARIVCDDGSDLKNCRMLDVSAFGAQLELENALTLPGKFVLLLSHDGRLRRQCIVVWRKQNAVGIEFNPPFPTKINQRRMFGGK
jgi:hypothetical protein